MIASGTINLFSLILMRMSGCILLNPILGRRNIPSPFRVGLTLVMTLLVTTFTDIVPPPAQTTVFGFLFVLLKELMVGLIIGFVISLFNYVVSFGGELIDLQMGLSMSKIFDPSSNVNMSLSATFFNLLYTFLFFSAGGHLTLMRLFMISGQVVPYGGVIITTGLYTAILDIFIQCTILAVKFALPIIALEILIEMGMGMIMKAIPQINVFVINIQAKVLLGLVMLVAMFVPFSEFLERLITIMFETIDSVMLLLR